MLFSSDSTPAGRNLQRGLTLIEVLIVSPIIILLIGVMIGYLTSLTGESLQANTKSKIMYDTHYALDEIEKTVINGVEFCRTYAFSGTASPCRTTSPTVSNQGSNNSTANFFYSLTAGQRHDLIVLTYATTASPLSSARATISRNPATDGPYLVPVVFFVQDGTLWKRTLRGQGTYTGTPWQRPSCAAGITTTPCQREDERLLDNVSNISIAFYKDASADSSFTPPTAQEIIPASTATISLTVSRQAAGETLEYTGKLRATSINIGNRYQ